MLQHIRDEATGDVDGNNMSISVLMDCSRTCSLKKQTNLKFCIQKTEKSCGYRVEVSQHNETSQ